MKSQVADRVDVNTLLSTICKRTDAFKTMLDDRQRREWAQFFTPQPVAALMASLSHTTGEQIKLLDAGAGTGNLTAALVAELCSRSDRPDLIDVTVVEIDDALTSQLQDTLADCGSVCRRMGIGFRGRIVRMDFFEFGAQVLSPQYSFDSSDSPAFDIIISNPPYKKLLRRSEERRHMESVGESAPNAYAGFLAIAARLLRPKGELIAITPRSFCNGTYFLRFRRRFLETMRFTRIHVIESRKEAFVEEGVLQENVIFRAMKGVEKGAVVITVGGSSEESPRHGRSVDYDELVWPGDEDMFVHLPSDPGAALATESVRRLPCTLQTLDLAVSTGRVVDFRVREHLRETPEQGCAPLIYPVHFSQGLILWPRRSRKPNAIRVEDETARLLVPAGYYVLIRRLSSKEERRRIVTAVYDPTRIPDAQHVGFENHLNFIHAHGKGLDADLAYGLSAFLSSAHIDTYFRQFSGHTQVNAGDLRKLRFPHRDQLIDIGAMMRRSELDQSEVDQIAEECLFNDTLV